MQAVLCNNALFLQIRACLHGGGGPQLGDVTHLGVAYVAWWFCGTHYWVVKPQKCAWSAHEQAAKLAVSLLLLTFITLHAKLKNPHATPASLGGVTGLSILSLILIWSRLHDRWGDPPHVTSPICGPQPPCKQALSQISMYCVITLFVCPWAKCYSIYCRYICIYCRYIGVKTIFVENKIFQKLYNTIIRYTLIRLRTKKQCIASLFKICVFFL